MSRQENTAISMDSYILGVADVQTDPLDFNREIALSGVIEGIGEVIFNHKLLSRLPKIKNKNAIPVHPEMSQHQLEALMVRGKLSPIPIAHYEPVIRGDIAYTIICPISGIKQFETVNLNNPTFLDLVTATPGLIEITTRNIETGSIVFHDYNSTNALLLVRGRVDNFRKHSVND